MGRCTHVSSLLKYKPQKTRIRFELHVRKSPTCWLWTGCRSGKYGWFAGEGAHRSAWLIYKGAIPDGMFVLHRCDVPLCVNPDHLFLGTALDNMRDMDAKGRRKTVTTTGEKHWSSKLTREDIPIILARRRAGEFLHVIAGDYGVGYTAIQAICNGRNWKHITASQG